MGTGISINKNRFLLFVFSCIFAFEDTVKEREQKIDCQGRRAEGWKDESKQQDKLEEKEI